MNTFLKITLIVLAVLIGIKLLPLTLAAIGIIAAVALVAAVVGLSALAVVFAVAVAAATILSPLWLPVLLVVGFVTLLRNSRRSKTA